MFFFAYLEANRAPSWWVYAPSRAALLADDWPSSCRKHRGIPAHTQIKQFFKSNYHNNNDDNNSGFIWCTYSRHLYYSYPGFSPGNLVACSAFEGRNSCRVTIYYTFNRSRETIVDKMPCLGAYTPSGIRTCNPLITSQEREPLHHSAPIHIAPKATNRLGNPRRRQHLQGESEVYAKDNFTDECNFISGLCNIFFII